MKRIIEKGSEEFQMFQDFWALYKNYGIAEQSDEYWEELLKASDEFCRKYNSTLARKLALAVIETLEEQVKQK